MAHASGITTPSGESVSQALPERFECPACHYDLAGAELAQCSECGHTVTQSDLDFHRTWLEGSGRLKSMVRRQLVVFGAVAIVMTVGVAILSKSAMAAAGGLFLTSAAPVMSIAAGWRISRLSGRRAGDLGFSAWLRSHAWLHGPWLCIPICAVLAASARLLGGRTMDLLAGVGFLFWLAAAPVCLIIWAIVYGRAAKALRLQGHWYDIAAVLLAICVLGCAVALGFAGGSAAVTWLSAW